MFVYMGTTPFYDVLQLNYEYIKDICKVIRVFSSRTRHINKSFYTVSRY